MISVTAGEPRSRSRARFAITTIISAIFLAAATGCSSSAERSDETVPSSGGELFEALSDEGQQLVRAFFTGGQARRLGVSGQFYVKRGDTYEAVDDPTFTVDEVDADGDLHRASNVIPGFGLGPARTRPNGPFVEHWSDRRWLYVEYTGIDAALAGRRGLAPEGWLAPGMFKVNLRRVVEQTRLGMEAFGVLESKTGYPFDDRDYMYWLALHLAEAERDPDDENLRRIDSTLGSVYDMFGEQANFGDPESKLADSAVVYRFSADDQGRLDYLTVEITFVSNEPSTVPEAERPSERRVLTYDLGYDIADISVPREVADDRTDAWIEWVDHDYDPD